MPTSQNPGPATKATGLPAFRLSKRSTRGMTWGACRDETLKEEIKAATGTQCRNFPGGSVVKNLPAVQETQV